MDQRQELIKWIYDFLKKNGFIVSEPDLYGLVTFDLICRREDERYILKILYNVNTFSKIGVVPLIKMSALTNSKAIIIGEKAGNSKLERGVLYFRHGVPILSFESFKDYINGESPFIYSAPGGFYVAINGQKMRMLREKNNYSIGYISQKLGVSRRSVSLYESGSSATIDIYLKLESILKGDISRNVNVSITEEPSMPVNVGNDFINEVLNMMNNIGYVSEYISRNPFDGLSYNSDSHLMIGTFNSINENTNRIISIKKISEVLEDTPILINMENCGKQNIYGCRIISIRDLRKIYDIDSFNELLEK
ncbi:MAG: transcriptional regulator [Candidatus Thermoplasmatota archaeon]|uniref:transcriptional regulator n=1 Tax=Ferroplasma sp. TaxID=2591003 RepID=UPI00180BBC6C|nr:transcriptional regulator [Ferroplasma sp.]MCL4311771.1 transcriptional regulator [Candidatus Thermoplasmatota archaeon]HII82076.1 transcriptional regulator [Ferroplasma sp.]